MLTHEDVRKVMDAALAEARANSWNVSIAILDDGGHLLGFERMDGATPANAGIAVEKGRTAALSRRSSGMWEDLIKGGRTAMLKMPDILPVQGGMPIMVDGVCIGGVGVSGVQSQQDEQIATAGISVLLKK
jgi:glc operon protein GlcG